VVTGSGTDETARLDGFTVTAGCGSYISGAGMNNVSGSPTVANSRFTANFAQGVGIAMSNTAQSSPTVINCRFIANRSGMNGGGAIGNGGGSNPVIVDSVFRANWANYGGAILNSGSAPHLIGCAFYGNNCTWSWGGAVGSIDSPNLQITNCLFSGNSCGTGAALYNVDSDVTMVNCTVMHNGTSTFNNGGGIRHSGGHLSIHNSILWGNIDNNLMDERAQIWLHEAQIDLSQTCVQGCDELCEDSRYGNFSDDPLLANPHGDDGVIGTEDDYGGLAALSPCIDAGDNTVVPVDSFDQDHDGDMAERLPLDFTGHARFTDGCLVDDAGTPDPPAYANVVDLGCYEYQPHDADFNGSIDLGDYALVRQCATGPLYPVEGATCMQRDRDCDGDSDLRDMGWFQLDFSY